MDPAASGPVAAAKATATEVGLAWKVEAVATAETAPNALAAAMAALAALATLAALAGPAALAAAVATNAKQMKAKEQEVTTYGPYPKASALTQARPSSTTAGLPMTVPTAWQQARTAS